MSEKKKQIVLIVEDNDLNLKLFQDILSAHELETVETRDGAKAIELAHEVNPTLIIMDIQLPNISGIELIRQLKSNESTKDIPIIAVTAFAMQEDEAKIMAAGCEDYLAKPISIVPFIETVQKHLIARG